MPSEIRVDKVSSTTSPYDPVFSTTGGALSHRNMIINGGMQVAQRTTTTHPNPKGANDDGYYTIDRYRLKCAGSTPSRFNLIQDSVTDLAGFSKALKVDCTTASTSPGADDYVILAQRMEGFDLQQMEKGFSSAKSVTLSFYVKGTASRTYVVELRDTSSTVRSASQQFTVTASWVRHTITFPGDTGGDKIPNDNTHGLEVNFWLHAGANFTGGTYTAATWANYTAANTAVGISDSGAGAMQTTSDEVLFTGVQLELGSVATPFEHRSFADELARCQRYYWKITGNLYQHFAIYQQFNNTNSVFPIHLPVPMRHHQPTITQANLGRWTEGAGSWSTSYTTVSFYDTIDSENNFTLAPFQMTGAGTSPQGLVGFQANGYLTLDAEL